MEKHEALERVFIDHFRMFCGDNPFPFLGYEADTSPWPTVPDWIPQPGECLQQRREQLGMSRQLLSSFLSYENIQDGVDEIQQWELNHKRPAPTRASKLESTLGLQQETVDYWWYPLVRLEERNARVESQIRSHEVTLLQQHHQLLLDNYEQIISKPELANIMVEAAHISILGLASGMLRLGELLTGWRDGSLVCTDTDEPSLIYSIRGNHLDGVIHSGIIPISTPPFTVKKDFALTQVVKQIRQRHHPVSPMNLAQLLSDLGVKIPDTVARGVSGQTLLIFRYETRDVHCFSKIPVASLIPSPVIQPTWRSPIRYVRVRRGGQHICIGCSIAPHWNHETLTLGADWRYTRGCLLYRDLPLLWFDSSPPPDLFPAIIDLAGIDKFGHWLSWERQLRQIPMLELHGDRIAPNPHSDPPN